MDTKLKNNCKKRIRMAVAGILVIALGVLACFPLVGMRAGRSLNNLIGPNWGDKQVNTDLLTELYRGCYVLYQEAMQGDSGAGATEVYLEIGEIPSGGNAYQEAAMLQNEVESWMYGLQNEFELYRSGVDYCTLSAEGNLQSNTVRGLNTVLDPAQKPDEDLEYFYSCYFVLRFNENGAMSVEVPYSDTIDADLIMKALGAVAREDGAWGDLANSVQNSMYDDDLNVSLKRPTDFAVAFGVIRDSGYPLVAGDWEDYYYVLRTYAESGGWLLYVVSWILVAVWVFFMTSTRIWKDGVDLNRPGKWYLMEVAATGVIAGVGMVNPFIEMMSINWLNFSGGYEGVWNLLTGANSGETLMGLLGLWFALACGYGALYLCIRFLRPVFALGIREYIRQYSLIYQIYPWTKRQWERFKDKVDHVDFSRRSTKVIVQIVALNFVVLMIITCFWFYGIFVLVLYSVLLFFVLCNYYDRISRNYQVLLANVNQIAEGRLDVEITEDIGIFEPFKGELAKIRTGFKKAVDDEVKSQRMKTELITNVSHDLKTPLTAILTYVELLKNEDLTDEERRAYIDTLERKSLRLKVLIEDLFEVSKASSDNITLNIVDVDVVNLMKQVSIEHEEAYEAAKLELRWKVPEEKVVLQLDSQKAYRVFENLFSNIQKYAMPGSRVYVDVTAADGTGAQDAAGVPETAGRRERAVEIILRNMSAAEMNFAADEITERFVRGDASRNTEGSGLGLAIAKSFTEAMGGSFAVEVDGDLFKVVIRWGYGIL